MLKKLKLLPALMVFSLLSACGGGSSSPTPAPAPEDDSPQTGSSEILALQNSGAIPTLDRTASLSGSDQNSNGIRDDIDQYISSNFVGVLQQSAANQSAIALQRALLVDTTDSIEVKTVATDIASADNCLYTVFDTEQGTKSPSQVSREMESITTNTKPRLLKYLEFSKALDGSTWALPSGDTCE